MASCSGSGRQPTPTEIAQSRIFENTDHVIKRGVMIGQTTGESKHSCFGGLRNTFEVSTRYPQVVCPVQARRAVTVSCNDSGVIRHQFDIRLFPWDVGRMQRKC
ncbi:hypothetical protein Bbelb_273010 [Branchiostoma belcheri]|nr:hypothetical protein Bbelb_273010 [Branchiostoma belcheri]